MLLVETGTEALSHLQVSVEVAMTLGSYDSADLIMLQVSVTDRGAVWSPWQPCIGESQRIPLEFWS